MVTKDDIIKMDRKDVNFLTVQLCSLITDDIDWMLEKYPEVLEKTKKILEFKNEKVENFLLEKMMKDYEKKYGGKEKREEEEEEKVEFGKRKRERENIKMTVRPMIEENPFEEKVEKVDLPDIKKSKKRSGNFHFGKNEK
jgi:hypothetical protein